MLARRIAFLPLAFVLLISMTTPPAFSQITYYIGNDIHILSETVIRVRAWVRPYNIDWEEFKATIYNPNKDSFIEGLILRVRLMFGLSGMLLIVDYGVDDSQQKVFVTVTFSIEDSAYYDSKYKVIKFKDVYKEARRGWFDEITVSSKVRVYSWSPKPTRWDDYNAYWFNPSMEAAPLWYEIALAPRYQVRVRIEGLPSSYSVQVRIEGAVVGTLRGGEEKVFIVTKSPVAVEIPAVVSAGKTRYVAEKSTQTAEADTLTVFKYYAEHLVELDASPRVGGIEVNGLTFSLPYSSWWREGSLLNLAAPRAIPVESTATVRKSYIFTGWSDGVTSPSRSITVNGPLSLVAGYVLSVEYYVKLEANFREAEVGLRGSGWYREGERITISADRTIYISDEVRLVFVEWSGLGFAASYTVVVDSPKGFKAVYKRQYRVRAYAPYGTILDDWYDEGDVATIRLWGLSDSYWYESSEVRRRFIGWRVERGNVPSTWGSELSFSVTSPVVLYAEFSAREYMVVIDSSVLFVEEGLVLNPSPDVTVIPLLVVDRFVGYVDQESGRLLGSRVLVDRPLRLVRMYRRDYTGLIIVLTLVIAGGAILLVIGRSLFAAGYSTGFKGTLAKSYAHLATIFVGSTRTQHEEYEKRVRELEEKIKEFKDYLAKLEQMHQQGEVTDEVYHELKNTYMKELEKYETELNNLRNKVKTFKEEGTKVISP